MAEVTIADHESGIADIGFLSGFIEALQAKPDQPGETVH